MKRLPAYNKRVCVSGILRNRACKPKPSNTWPMSRRLPDPTLTLPAAERELYSKWRATTPTFAKPENVKNNCMKTSLTKIETHDFFKELNKDAVQYLGDREFEISDIELPENFKLDELQYYIHKVGFYTVYLIKWCKQLEIGVDLLSNYDYKAKSEFNRVDHLSYNIENYIIRFQSVSDRILQVINGVFHLTIDESNVSNKIIMSNLKVTRTNVPSKFNPIKKYLNKLYNDRNTIVHRHSYLEKELRKLELFYHKNNNDVDARIKYYRSRKLKEYIKTKKECYIKYNQDLFELLPDLLDELLNEYRKQRDKLILLTRK